MGRAILGVGLLLAACAAPGSPPPPEAPAAAAPERGSGPFVPGGGPGLFGAEYDAALAAIGLDRSTARCTEPDLTLMGRGRFRTDLYAALQSDPTLVDRYARTLREGAFAAAPSAEGSSMYAAARLGASVRLGLLGDPLAGEVEEAAKPGALEAAMGRLGPGEFPTSADLPPPVRTAAALVVRAAARAEVFLLRAHPESEGESRFRERSAAEATLLLAGGGDALRREFEEQAARADLPLLARGAAEVLVAADRAAALLREAGAGGPFAYRAETALGTVLLRGGGDDADGEGESGPFLLRIDTGGNDRYGAGAAASPACPVSVLIDVAGNDTYESAPDAAAFGAGHFGVGALLDLGGNDRYLLRGDRSLGLGAGVFGVGLLHDAGGDDAYAGVAFCQGAGAVGWGTLTDLGGEDGYHAYAYAQGFGFVLGAGVLADLAGKDRYALDDADIRFPSAQSKEHNASLGQGFGFGVRADYTDGHSLAGGVGILADREGDDRYSCGVFGQGGGYWMGVGLLLDGAGDDAYDGAWYVQGAAAHFAVGVLEDGGGDDRYTATLNMAQGAGHDYSLGVLLDRGGDDVHHAPNLSLGAGNANGVGILVADGGDDTYVSRGLTLGHSSVATPADAPTLRHGSLTLGLFLDLGGRDRYLQAGPAGEPWPFAGDGRTWTRGERAGRPSRSDERGVGRDAGGPGAPRNP